MMSIISRPSVAMPRTFSITMSGGGSSQVCIASHTERTASEHISTYFGDFRLSFPSSRDQPLQGGVDTNTSGRRRPTMRSRSAGCIVRMSAQTDTCLLSR